MTRTTNAAALALAACAAPAFAQITFTPLGFADGTGEYSQATSVSDDGRFVGGHTGGVDGFIPLIWDGTTPNHLTVPLGYGGAYVNDISADGTQAVAISPGPNGFRGIYWNTPTTPVAGPEPTLPGANSSINCINGNGSVLGGFTNQTFFPAVESDAWSSLGGIGANHGDLAGGIREANFTGVTNDGFTFVGYANDGARRPIRYAGAGFEILGTVPGATGEGQAINIAPFGGTIVGDLLVGGVDTPAYWDAGGLAHLIGVASGFSGGLAAASSADGSMIVGSWYDGVPDEGTSTAFLWTQADGVRPLIDVLTTDYGADLTGWTLNTAADITPDGNTIVGIGLNPNGLLEAYKVTVPAPCTPALLGVGALVATRRRR